MSDVRMTEYERTLRGMYGPGKQARHAAVEELLQELDRVRGLESPEQAWARGASLMRAAFHTHAGGTLLDDDPLWGIEIPEYMPP